MATPSPSLINALYSREALVELDLSFLAYLESDSGSAPLAGRLRAARNDPEALAPLEESKLLIDLAEPLEDFIAERFLISERLDALRHAHRDLEVLFSVKRRFVQRDAARQITAEDAEALDAERLSEAIEELLGARFDELTYARAVHRWMEDETLHAAALQCAREYAAWAFHTTAGHERHIDDVLFHSPRAVHFEDLVNKETTAGTAAAVKVFTIHATELRRREGFSLTDPGPSLRGALDEAHYCIWCHAQGRDSCSHGQFEKKGTTTKGHAAFKKNPLGAVLAGCPLEEKISEFQLLKSQGYPIAALAVIVVDNPMVAATGHRICNDCMKACIYQKQEPVNIPEVESRTLRDVLELPMGFEIYSLLTRWNPMNLRRPLPRPASGYRILVAGMGPAGFTLAHHLLNDGHSVVGIDGLKIEPLGPDLSGRREDGSVVDFEPVADITALHEDLGSRLAAGFGGVAEYGITVRWDKNYLKMVRLLLERRREFSLFGGVRFGGTIDAGSAFALGFDHVALAIGAGRPTVLDIEHGLARGVRTASDFLMALQLTGAARTDSLANLQIRMPVVVIGGGLTGIDAATEALAYYPLQVEKFLARFEILCARAGEAAVRSSWSKEEAQYADEFLHHARLIRTEKAEAQKDKRPARVLELLNAWGGVTLAYRKRMVESPAYIGNHEEVQKALEEGIMYAENIVPLKVDIDGHGAVSGLLCRHSGAEADLNVTLPARTILVAAGTQPNTVLAREYPEDFLLAGRYFAACDGEGKPVVPEPSIAKPEHARILLKRMDDGRFISYFGDVHPTYAGNVVKAMASAKQGYPALTSILGQRQPNHAQSADDFATAVGSGLRSVVHAVVRLTPTITEIVIHSPFAAARFKPGQFFRVQNFEAHALRMTPEASRSPTVMAMEGVALTGASVDRERGLISCIALEMGGSADLLAKLIPGEPVLLMGPTGTPTETVANETVMLVGGGLGNAVLFSIGAAMREKGAHVLYFAGYKKIIDRYKVAEIEKAADTVVWCCDEAPGFMPTRPGDLSFVGNIVAAIEAYATGALGPTTIATTRVERILAIGSDRMMAAVARARHHTLEPYFTAGHIAIGSINSPMQCMMKEICAQCLQPHRDPVTGEVTYVFSCFNQDQELDRVDFNGLAQRLAQNSLQEKLTMQWIACCTQSTSRNSIFAAPPSIRATVTDIPPTPMPEPIPGSPGHLPNPLPNPMPDPVPGPAPEPIRDPSQDPPPLPMQDPPAVPID